MDRRNQLNIMRNTYEQAAHEKNKFIQLLESVSRDQECELEELRRIQKAHSQLSSSLLVLSLQGIATPNPNRALLFFQIWGRVWTFRVAREGRR